MSENSNTGKTLLALLTGAAIGAGIGILFAPDKGTKTRKKIKHNVDETSQEISKRLTRAQNELSKTADKKKREFDKTLDDAVSAMSSKADNIISTVEEKLKAYSKKNS